METQKELKKQLLEYLENGQAHKTLDEAVLDFPAKMINSKPENVPYTFWQLLEHVRISQYDIINFTQNPNYRYLDYPKDYWPPENQIAHKKDWDRTIEDFHEDLNTLKKIVKNSKTDLLVGIPHGEGQTIFREVLLVIDHNAYHIGEFIIMRRVMGIWK